jgi:hypothetical protein
MASVPGERGPDPLSRSAETRHDLARLDDVKLLTGLAGLALLGLGLIMAAAALVVPDQALKANLIPVGFVLIGLGVIVLTYWVVPTRHSE